MAALTIFLFGNVQVYYDERPISLRPTAKSLLAFLILQQYQQPHNPGQRREVLANQLWQEHDPNQARRCLSTTLWRLRRELEPAKIPQGTFLTTPTNGTISFNFASDHWIDVTEFEANVQQGLRHSFAAMTGTEASYLEKARQLYTGDLFEDCYGDWVYSERERLNLLYLNCLARLMRFYDREGNYEKGLACGQEILNMDPLREQIHRYLMRLYLANGQRAKAIQQYEICKQVLAQELSIEPMVETKALYAQITAAPQNLFLPLVGTEEPLDRQQVVSQLKTAMQGLTRIQSQLQQVQQLISQLEPHL